MASECGREASDPVIIECWVDYWLLVVAVRVDLFFVVVIVV